MSFLAAGSLQVALALAISSLPLDAAEILERGSSVVKVAGGGSFTEGPVTDLSGQLFFSDGGRVMRLATDRELSVFNTPEGAVNGMMFDIKGRLHLCQHRGHRVSRLESDGSLTVLATRCDGFPEDDVEAVKWFRKASEQGNAGGQFALGHMYDQGDGVPQNQVEGYAWIAVARANGHERSRTFLSNIATRMTRDQVATAQQRAAELFAQINANKEKAK
jgi:hypothetical protein